MTVQVRYYFGPYLTGETFIPCETELSQTGLNWICLVKTLLYILDFQGTQPHDQNHRMHLKIMVKYNIFKSLKSVLHISKSYLLLYLKKQYQVYQKEWESLELQLSFSNCMYEFKMNKVCIWFHKDTVY